MVQSVKKHEQANVFSRSEAFISSFTASPYVVGSQVRYHFTKEEQDRFGSAGGRLIDDTFARLVILA